MISQLMNYLRSNSSVFKTIKIWFQILQQKIYGHNNGYSMFRNIEFIARMSDYIIDFGNHGGNSGGKIVAQGNPKSVFNDTNSSLCNL